MSTELTFRQKLIRLSSGAAICGLSLSFLLGEAVDTQAKHLRGWVVEPRLFPTAFLPLNPILQSISGFQTEGWQKVLIATNSLSFPQGQETSLFKIGRAHV